MRLWPKSLKWRTILLTLLGLVAVGGTVGFVWWREIWDHFNWQKQMATLRESPHPLTRKLARGEVRAGDSINEVMASYPPERVWQIGRFTEAHYGNNPDLIAMDGRLVFARSGWGTPGTIIFKVMSPAEEREWSEGWTAYYDLQIEDWKCRHSALCGVAALLPRYSPYDRLAHPPPYPEELWEAEQADPHRAAGGVMAYMSHCPTFRELAAGPAEVP